MKIFAAILLAGLILLSASCKDEIEVRPDVDRGLEYYPLAMGMEWVYQLDSIIFDDAQGGNSLDTSSWYIRERVIEQYIQENTGDTIFVLERAQQLELEEEWIVGKHYAAIRNADEAQRIEENQRYVKLRFPLSEGKEWDPLAYIDGEQEVQVGTELIEMFKAWGSEVVAYDVDDQVGDLNFSGSALHCYQAEDDNEIERRFVFEKYARGVGLIFRQDSILDSRCKRLGTLEPCLEEDTTQSPPVLVSQPWIVKGEKGYILEQRLVDYR